MDNELLNKYFMKFGELPPIMMTQTYESDLYQIAMEYAIENNEKLTYENIDKFFNNNYDLIVNDNNNNDSKKENKELDNQEVNKGQEKDDASKLFGINLK